MIPFEQNDINKLKYYTDVEDEIRKWCDEFWDSVVLPELHKCKTKDDTKAIFQQISHFLCNDGGEFRSWPGTLSVKRALFRSTDFYQNLL